MPPIHQVHRLDVPAARRHGRRGCGADTAGFVDRPEASVELCSACKIEIVFKISGKHNMIVVIVAWSMKLKLAR